MTSTDQNAEALDEYEDGDDVDFDDDLDNDPKAYGGHFSPEGRRIAVTSALGLVATYFQQKGSREFDEQFATAGVPIPDATQQLIEALRFRVALASTRRILDIAKRILRNPSFRYGRERELQVGVLRGRLDIRSYLTDQGKVTEIPSFPVVSVRRQMTTPENVLLAVAALRLARELRSPLMRSLPASAPDRKRAASYARDLERLIDGPRLRECKTAALDLLRRGQVQVLADTVHRRIRAGHIGTPGPYEELVTWVSAGLNGSPAAQAGDIGWDFYDASFDTTLFEIWCLSEINTRLVSRLGTPTSAPSLSARKKEPVSTWESGNWNVRLDFQREPKTITDALPSRWLRGAKPLVGKPDITFTRVNEDGERMVFLDPKLRQRPGREPSEELYKMLGYFNQFKLDADGEGVILYYAPFSQKQTVTVYRPTGGLGTLLGVALDPERPAGNAKGWLEVLGLLLPPDVPPAEDTANVLPILCADP